MLVQAQVWEMRRNPMIIMAPVMVILMAGFFSIMPDLNDKMPGMAPALLVLMTAFIVGWMIPSISIAEEKERRTLEALLLTPARPLEILGAKAVIAVITALICSVSIMAFYQEFPERPVLFLAVFLVALTMTISAGTFIGLVMPDARSVGAVSTNIMLLVFFTGFPVIGLALPKVWDALLWLPGRPVYELFRAAWTGHDTEIVRHTAVLLVYTALAVFAFSRQLRRQAFRR